VRCWLAPFLALALLFGCAEKPEAQSKPREHPAIPERIALDNEQCPSCKVTEADVCELYYRFGCGEASCEADIPCDPECCIRNGQAQVRAETLKARVRNGWVEKLHPLVELGRSFEVDGVLHHRVIDHIVGAYETEIGSKFWFVEHTGVWQDGTFQPDARSWQLAVVTDAGELNPQLLPEPVGPIIGLERVRDWLVFAEYDAQGDRTTVFRLSSKGGEPEKLGEWPGSQQLHRSANDFRVVIGETGQAIDPITKTQAIFHGERAVQPIPDLRPCKGLASGEAEAAQSVSTNGKLVLWVLPDPAAPERGPTGQLRYCQTADGVVGTFGKLQAPAGTTSLAVHYAWTDAFTLTVSFADGVFVF
jgi:hypothetical protein